MNPLKLLLSKGFTIFSSPYELNILGIRAKNSRPKTFDDTIHVFFTDEYGNWSFHKFLATTDPGRYYLNNPILPEGTAALIEGQYLNAYSIGLHKGSQKALVQMGPVKISRDKDRNNKLSIGSNTFTGLFGINIHRALSSGRTKFIDRFSAGCQVFENAKDFEFFLELCEKHRALYGNRFSYSLIDKRSSKISLGTGLLGALSLGSLLTLLTIKTQKDDTK